MYTKEDLKTAEAEYEKNFNKILESIGTQLQDKYLRIEDRINKKISKNT